MYRCEATSVAGFVQQLAVAYVANGYWFYVTGTIPEGKDPRAVDAKLIGRYGIDVSKWTRCRRKKEGQASVQYLRLGRFFILIATRGKHSLFADERSRLRDAREHPIRFHGYAIGCRRAGEGGKYHPSVRIDREHYRQIKGHFTQIALHWPVEDLCRALRSIPYEPYAPIRNQLVGIRRAVNRRRQAAGLETVPWNSLRLRRISVRPFGDVGFGEAAGGGTLGRQCSAERPCDGAIEMSSTNEHGDTDCSVSPSTVEGGASESGGDTLSPAIERRGGQPISETPILEKGYGAIARACRVV